MLLYGGTMSKLLIVPLLMGGGLFLSVAWVFGQQDQMQMNFCQQRGASYEECAVKIYGR